MDRHVVEDLSELAPLVQILDLPVPQMVDFVADALRFLDFPTAEQVIDVPKISCSPCPSRSPIPEPQSAEQLVEVPTVLSPTRMALRIEEQIGDIPASVRGVSGSFQGFPPEQISAKRTASQIADIPVPGRGGSGCLLGFLPEQRTTALHVSQERISDRIVEQIDAGGDFPSRRAGPRVVLPRQGSAAGVSWTCSR